MARARSFPADFLKDPDIIALSGADACLILIGLVLGADDHGRGFAHSTLLGREIRGYRPEQIDSALEELVTLYQVGRHRYYSLPRWQDWQKLREPARSKFPPPPDCQRTPEEGKSDTCLEVSTKNFEKLQETSGTVQTVFQEGEGEKEKEEEQEGEGEEKPSPDDPPTNVLSFPAGRRDTTTSATSEQSEQNQPPPPQTQQTTREVAAIVHLSVSDALGRIVADYQHDPLLSLLGEADAAREYIDDPRRNRQAQRMSPAFFRRWLRREHEDAQLRQSPRHTTAATGGSRGTTATAPVPPGPARPVLPKSLMHLADQDQPGHSVSPAKKGQQP